MIRCLFGQFLIWVRRSGGCAIRSIVGSLFLLAILPVSVDAQGSAAFLTIAPGARAGGMGEAHVAVADDAYATYWNPAGLAFLDGSQIALMHANWLPNIASDMTYDFAALRLKIGDVGSLGAHLIYFNLGEQIRMGETAADVLGTFTSYSAAFGLSYSRALSVQSAFGITVKAFRQSLVEVGAGAEKGKGSSTDFSLDFGYLESDINEQLIFGITVTNFGPSVAFIDEDQSDPQPTSLTLGVSYTLLSSATNSVTVVYDLHKPLVAAYPAMDWDGDMVIGGFNKDAELLSFGSYNSAGQQETAHADPFYVGIFTSWVDDWLLGGDRDMAPSGSPPDRIIGGYEWADKNGNGQIEAHLGEMVRSAGNPGDEGWGEYNAYGQREVGSAEDRSVGDELKKLSHNIGVEYWYDGLVALRAGYIYDVVGDVSNPTFGLGVRVGNGGFDFGYTAGPVGHPLSNTMRFSLSIEF